MLVLDAGCQGCWQTPLPTELSLMPHNASPELLSLIHFFPWSDHHQSSLGPFRKGDRMERAAVGGRSQEHLPTSSSQACPCSLQDALSLLVSLLPALGHHLSFIHPLLCWGKLSSRQSPASLVRSGTFCFPRPCYSLPQP